jgi:hypothetical protein
MFDVIAVNIETGEVRIIAENKSERNAEAIENMAIMRRGVEEEFFDIVKHNTYKDGDKRRG